MRAFALIAAVLAITFVGYVKTQTETPPEEFGAASIALSRTDDAPKAASAEASARPAAETSAPAAQPEPSAPAAEPSPDCARVGPFAARELAAASKKLRQAKLLDKVLLEDILGPDEYVVFIIPTTTEKGAQALVRQVKARGYRLAVAITDGPLKNATRLGVFKTEEAARNYLEKAKQDLHMDALRMTRMMGLATGNVNMVFRGLTDEESAGVTKFAEASRKKLSACEAP